MSHIKNEFLISEEAAAHRLARKQLIAHCFGEPDWGRAAHYFRQHTPPDRRYSLVALNDKDQLLGNIRFSPVILPNSKTVLMLGPLAIDPALRGQGIGSSLVQQGLTRLHRDDWPAVIVIGDPGYFATFSFHTDCCKGLDVTGKVAPLKLMGLEWQASYLAKQQGMIQRVMTNRRV